MGGDAEKSIGVNELHAVAKKLGMKMTNEEVEEMIYQTLPREQ